MSKGKDSKKMAKKAPVKTKKEKRAEKRLKKKAKWNTYYPYYVSLCWPVIAVGVMTYPPADDD